VAVDGRKVVVVMPAYNAGRTLESTYSDVPLDVVDEVLVIDDASHDDTVAVARRLGLTVYVHPENRGYGGNQKTCYTHALAADADIVVMLHPDYQYDPRRIPELIAPVVEGRADLVLGSRLKDGRALEGGMPFYKYLANRFLTAAENLVLGQRLSEMHTGYRAFSRRLLETINFLANSEDFVFDSEVIVETVAAGLRIAEISVPAKYQPEASSIGFRPSVRYGLATLWTLVKYLAWRLGFRVRNLPPRRYPAPRGGAFTVSKLSVLVPLYNEADTVIPILEKVLAVDVPKEVIVVDDGSTDGSYELATEFAQGYRDVKVFRHPENRGKGAAIRTALSQATGEVVVIQDADLEYDPQDFPRLLEPILRGEADVVYGSRVRARNPISYRRYYLGGRLLSLVASLLYGRWITDEPTCYKMIRRDVLAQVELECTGFEFCPEVTAKLLRRGARYREVPIRYYPRSISEGKKIRAWDGLVAIYTLLRLRFFRRLH